MEQWKLKPGLDATLIRSYHRNLYYTWGGIFLINKYKMDRYILWTKSDECKHAAASAIQESYINYKKNKLYKAYQNLSFFKILLTKDIDYDVLLKINDTLF